MEQYLEHYQRWLTSSKVDEATKAELAAIGQDDTELRIRFSAPMTFGTAGLRSVMKAGISCMNVYTVAHATQGLADFIIAEGEGQRTVVIAYDSRNNSRLYAETSAQVLAANGIRCYLFSELRPTPVLSFAVRELGCIAGINITASHNPKEYNGYKTYWQDGAQLSLEQADAVYACINAVDIFDGVKKMSYEEALQAGLITVLERDFDEKYMEKVVAEQVNPAAFDEVKDTPLKVVYTPLHGAGYRLVPEVLRRVGLPQDCLITVDAQMDPDGNFTGVEYPNPEIAAVYTEGIRLAKEVDSDLIIATDPDADRVGTMVRTESGEFVPLTGNQIGALLTEYIVTAYERTGTMPPEPFMVKTIVSTELVTRFCKDHNILLYNVLTGFKFIGEMIVKHENLGHGSFLLGFEESYGYLKGTYARDKDAVVATMLICEMAAYYRTKGMTLYDALQSLYDRYGHYREGVANVAMPGLDGADRIKAMLDGLRATPPATLAGEKLAYVRDYETQLITELATGKTESTGLPKSNVLYFETTEGNVAVIRPSGTEPKVKLYLLVHGDTAAEAERVAAAFKNDMSAAVGIPL